MISDSDPSDFDGMGKRRFLKTLAGFGVSATTLNHITKEAAAKHTEDLNKEIPYIKASHTNKDGDRNPLYGSISVEEFIKPKLVNQLHKPSMTKSKVELIAKIYQLE